MAARDGADPVEPDGEAAPGEASTAAGSSVPGEDAPPGDEGSAVVEFILVGTLLLFLFLGILQVGLILHIRNTLAADAAEGARHAANLGVPAADGGPYAQALIARTIPGRADTVCTGTDVEGPGGTPLVQVTCKVAVPLVLVPLGDGVTITVTGHAVKEQP
ncbi:MULTISPECIES: TadE/TadG family type IV pilus assembly protein [Frankia]|nr:MULTISPECIES: TadE/TadG family type IV pilus assembly protein [Frankia]